MKARRTILLLVLILTVITGCNNSPTSKPTATEPTITETIPAIGNNNDNGRSNEKIPRDSDPKLTSEDDEVPTVNNGEAPTANSEEVPSANNGEVPTINNEEVPTVNNEEVPTVNNEEVPVYNMEPDEDILGISKNYLILLENKAQIESVLEFKRFKESKGYNVTIKSVDTDVSKKNGIDVSETIHNFLKEMDKELLLDYVLFIGEPYNKNLACPQNTGGIIPMRYLYPNDENHNTRYHYDYYNYNDPTKNAFNTPTDIYYAFECDWDYDNDGYAGESQEIREYREVVGEPELMFYLGRIPFSDSNTIESVLKTTIDYEKSRKQHSNSLIASGILGYPESKEFPYVADGAYYADTLSKNLLDKGIETVTLYEKSGIMPSIFECTYPLNYENFKRELNNMYDLTYTFGHGGYSMMFWEEDSNNNGLCDETIYNYYILYPPEKKQLTGFFYMDGCHTMRVESDSENPENLHIQDFMISRMNCAALATTRESGFNPQDPGPRIVTYMFIDDTLIMSKAFYETEAKMIFSDLNLLEAYIYCYLGDPSLRLRR